MERILHIRIHNIRICNKESVVKKYSLILFFGFIVLFVYELILIPSENEVPSEIVQLSMPENIISIGALKDSFEFSPNPKIPLKYKDKIIELATEYNRAEEIKVFQVSAVSKLKQEKTQEVTPFMKLIIKFIFSFMFACTALRVILSQKYDKETKSWAFSALSLISGVWIGTVS